MSGKRGTGGDLEATVVLGLPTEVMVTLVVSAIPDVMPDVGACKELGREDKDPAG